MLALMHALPCARSALLMIYGITGIFVQAVLLRPLLRVAGERGAATVGCVCFAARLLLMTSARPTAALALPRSAPAAPMPANGTPITPPATPASPICSGLIS
jgi:hypothetical protein